ncbi:hypothetical protein VSS74_20505, partial [Conexibacter stalactiti]
AVAGAGAAVAGAGAAVAGAGATTEESSDLAAALLELFIPFAMAPEERAGWARRLGDPHADGAAPAQ